MAKKKAKDPADTDQPPPASEVIKCRLCEEEVEKRHLSQHLWTVHAGMTLAEYASWRPGQPHARVIEIGTVRRVPPASPPEPKPEPRVSIRLADVETNPPSVSVEARPCCVYHFTRGKYQFIPVADARLLLPNEISPGKYGHLIFEGKTKGRKRKTGKQRRKK